MAGFFVGLYYLHLWLGNTLVGLLGGLLDKMPAGAFWLLHAALVASAGVVFLVVRLLFGRLLRGEPPSPDISVAPPTPAKRHSPACSTARWAARVSPSRRSASARRAGGARPQFSESTPRSGWFTPPSMAG